MKQRHPYEILIAKYLNIHIFQENPPPKTYHLRYIILLLFVFLFEKKFFSSFFCLRSETEIQKSYWG